VIDMAKASLQAMARAIGCPKGSIHLNKGHGKMPAVPSARPPERLPGRRGLTITAYLPSRAAKETGGSRTAVLQRCGEIACLPSWGQAAGALDLAKRSFRGRPSSQLYAMTRRPLQACEASDASQTAGACITSG
jgi:hypothetical protein